MALCECGCGGYASPGKRFIRGHYILTEEIKRKRLETQKRNKEIREGKRPAPELPFCKCGCGGRVTKPGNKYIAGHHLRGRPSHMKGKKQSKEAKRKISESLRKKNPMDNPESRKKVSKALTGRRLSEETKEKLRQVNLGKHLLEETKRKISKANTGKKHTEEHNRKVSEAKKGKPSWIKGLTKETSESVRRQSEKVSGKNHPFYGKQHKEETKKELSEIVKSLWRDPVYVEMMLKARRVEPNKPEKYLLEILNNLFLNEYAYNGNFSAGITIAGKVPDFVNINGQKKLIELFGDYWHKGEDPQIRIDLFKEYGWDCLVIWEHELKDIDAVINKVLEFNCI